MMPKENSAHWKTGLAFVGGCVALGTALAFGSSESRTTIHSRTDSEIESHHDATKDQSEDSLRYEMSGGSDEGRDVISNEMSYQEQLQRSGDVDGRSKDYFTPDGDEEFGGAVIGMDYADFRDRLRYAGFEPLAVSPRWRCETDSGYKSDCNYQYPETESCDDNSALTCRYLWTNGDNDFMVVTKGGEGGQVTKMSYNR